MGVQLVQGPVQDETLKAWQHMLKKAAAAGVDGGILACTDLNAIGLDHFPLPLVDATEVLARACAQRWFS